MLPSYTFHGHQSCVICISLIFIVGYSIPTDAAPPRLASAVRFDRRSWGMSPICEQGICAVDWYNCEVATVANLRAVTSFLYKLPTWHIASVECSTLLSARVYILMFRLWSKKQQIISERESQTLVTVGRRERTLWKCPGLFPGLHILWIRKLPLLWHMMVG